MIKNRIAELRKAKNIKQVDLAKTFNVSQGGLSNWETGSYEPDFETAIKLADYFEVSVDYLLGRDEEQKKPPAETGGLEEYCQMLDKLGIVNDIEAQKKLLTKIGNLNKEQKDLILQMIDNFKD